ncbi:hypothetical protein ABIF50_009523 [Bradyrhizobium diazoefficiens]
MAERLSRFLRFLVLPLPLAGEGWGEGVYTIEDSQEAKALTRRYAPTSPACGRGAPSLPLAHLNRDTSSS